MITRRDFLKSTGSAAALGGLSVFTRPERVFGANDRVRIAVVGLHGHGHAAPIIAECVRQHVGFALVMDSYANLVKMAESLPESAWKPFSAHVAERVARAAAKRRTRRKRDRVRRRKAQKRGYETLATTGQWALLPVIAIIPVSEAMSDVIQIFYFRLTHGRRFFKMAPIHLHFELLGWSETQIVQRFWLIGLLAGMIGVGLALV